MVAPPTYDGPFDPKKDPNAGRKNYVASLPQELKHLACTCELKHGSDKHGYQRVHSRGDFWVRSCCRKPTNLWAYIQECDVCEEYYVVEFFPDNWLLCPGCREANEIALPDPDQWLKERLESQQR
jgi:hypothetical protein